MVSLSSVRKPLSSAWLTPRFVGIRCAVHSTTDGFDDIAAPGGLVRSLAQASATREPDFGPDDGPRDRPGAARSRSSRGRRCERSTVSRSSTSSRLSRSRSGHRGTGAPGTGRAVSAPVRLAPIDLARRGRSRARPPALPRSVKATTAATIAMAPAGVEATRGTVRSSEPAAPQAAAVLGQAYTARPRTARRSLRPYRA